MHYFIKTAAHRDVGIVIPACRWRTPLREVPRVSNTAWPVNDGSGVPCRLAGTWGPCSRCIYACLLGGQADGVGRTQRPDHALRQHEIQCLLSQHSWEYPLYLVCSILWLSLCWRNVCSQDSGKQQQELSQWFACEILSFPPGLNLLNWSDLWSNWRGRSGTSTGRPLGGWVGRWERGSFTLSPSGLPYDRKESVTQSEGKGERMYRFSLWITGFYFRPRDSDFSFFASHTLSPQSAANSSPPHPHWGASPVTQLCPTVDQAWNSLTLHVCRRLLSSVEQVLLLSHALRLLGYLATVCNKSPSLAFLSSRNSLFGITSRYFVFWNMREWWGKFVVRRRVLQTQARFNRN